MQDTKKASALSSFLAEHGSVIVPEHLDELPALVRLFRETEPEGDTLSLPSLTWLTALLEGISRADERIYEHYRALVDLFRNRLARASRESLLQSPAWSALLEEAVQLGVLREDLYGAFRPVPHVGAMNSALRIMEDVQ